MKRLILLTIVLCAFKGFSQDQLNDYKYIVVPKKFDCFKNQNQYKTSTLIKYMFAQSGFNVFYEDALPEELKTNRCMGLYVVLNDKSSLFNTKTSIVLKDCDTNIVLETLEGVSKEKEYQEAYNEVIKEAFVSIEKLNYNYAPKTKDEEALTVSFKNDVKEVKKEGAKIPKNKVDDRVVEQKATIVEQKYVNKEPVNSNIKKAEPQVDKMVSVLVSKPGAEVLYAQEITNGFQLVDSTPKILMKILKTSKPNYFVAESGEKSGVVYRQEGRWYFEYYSQDLLRTEELYIKF